MSMRRWSRTLPAAALGLCLAAAGSAQAGQWGEEAVLLPGADLSEQPIPLAGEDIKELVYLDDGAIYSRRGRIGRPLGRPVELSVPPLNPRDTSLEYPDAQQNARGDTVVTWQEAPDFAGRIWASVLRPGRGYGPAQNVGGSRDSFVGVAPVEYDASLASDGHGLFVYSQVGKRPGFYFRNLSPNKRVFGRSRILHRVGPGGLTPEAHVGPDGSAVVAWIGGRRRSRLFVASRADAASRWKVQLLPTGGAEDEGVSVSMNDRGQFALAWSRTGPRSGTYAAVGSVRGGVGPARRVGLRRTQIPTAFDETERPAVAVDRRGGAIVAFPSGPMLRARVQAAVRKPGRRRFSRARPLSRPARLSEPQLRLSRTGHAVVNWRGVVSTKTPEGNFLPAQDIGVVPRQIKTDRSALHLDARGTVSAVGEVRGYVRLVSWTTSTRAGRPVDLGPGCAPLLAGSDSGHAVAIWLGSCRMGPGTFTREEPVTARVRAAVKTPRGAFGPPTVLGTAQGRDLDLSVGPGGDALATWRRRESELSSSDEILFGADFQAR